MLNGDAQAVIKALDKAIAAIDSTGNIELGSSDAQKLVDARKNIAYVRSGLTLAHGRETRTLESDLKEDR